MTPSGERNSQWKGDAVKYKPLHAWVRHNFDMTGSCEKCGRSEKATEWASIDHVYTRERADWLELCRSCHRLMDGSNKGRRLSAEARAKISAAKTGVKLGPMSAEHRAKVSASKTPEVRRGQALALWRTRFETMRWACS